MFNTVIRYGILSQGVGVIPPTPEFPRSGLISYWNFNETSGTIAYDSKGSEDIDLYNSATQSTGKNENSVLMPITTSYGKISDDGFGVYNSQQYSINAWVYLTDKLVLWSYDYTSHTNPYYSQHIRMDAEGAIDFYTNSNGNTFTYMVSNNGSISLNEWTMLTFTNDRNNLYMYINGAEVTEFIGTNIIPDTDIGYWNRPVWIGRTPNASTLNSNNSKIDELGWWNRILTPLEVADLYNDGVGLFYERPIVFPISGLQSYWNLDNNVLDSYGNINGTLGTAGYIAGKNNECVENTGSTSAEYCVDFGNNYNFEYNEPCTYSLWYKKDPSQDGNPTPISNLNLTYPNSIDIYWGGTTTDLYSEISNSGSVGIGIIYTSPPQDTNWHHMVRTYDGSGNASGTKLYIDGVELPVKSIVRDNLGTNSIVNANCILRCGYRNTSQDWQGAIDEVAVWDRLLTPLEVADLYNDGVGLFYDPIIPERGLTAWYGDEVNSGVDRTTLSNGTSITQWDDLSGNDVHLYPINNTTNVTIRGSEYKHGINIGQATNGALTGDSATISGTSSFTRFYVQYKIDALAIASWSDGSWISLDNHLEQYERIGNNGGRLNKSSNDSASVWYIQTTGKDGTTIGDQFNRRNGVNNTASYTNGSSIVSIPLDSKRGIGCLYYGSGTWVAYDDDANKQIIVESIHYNRALLTQEIEQVETYLNNKYSIY